MERRISCNKVFPKSIITIEYFQTSTSLVPDVQIMGSISYGLTSKVMELTNGVKEVIKEQIINTIWRIYNFFLRLLICFQLITSLEWAQRFFGFLLLLFLDVVLTSFRK